MSERKRPSPDMLPSSEQLVSAELPLIIMRPISTAELVKRWNQVHDMGRISLTQVFCNENRSTAVFPKANVTFESTSGLEGIKLADNKEVKSELKAKGMYAVGDEDVIVHKGLCIGVIAPPLYTSEGENTSVDFFEDSNKIHSREKETATGSEQESQHAAVEFIRSEEIFRQYQLADKIFRLLPPGFSNFEGIKSQYERLVNAYNNGDSGLAIQAYGGFMNVLRKAAGDRQGVMRDTLATAWDEILIEEQLERYLRNFYQAPMLVAQLPVYEFSDRVRDHMLEHPNAVGIKKAYEYVDKAMRPNLSILSRVAENLPLEIRELLKPDSDNPGLLPGNVLRDRIKLYLELKLQETVLPPDVLLAFKSWQEQIKKNALQIYGEGVNQLAFGEHVQNLTKLFETSPNDPNVPRRYMKQLSRISQPDEAIIAAWGFDQYTGSENTDEERISNRQLLFSFPLGLEIDRDYSERTIVSSYPWRRVFVKTLKEGAKDYVPESLMKFPGFAAEKRVDKEVRQPDIQKKDIGPISLERHRLPVTYNDRPIYLLVTVRNKRETSHHRKVLERGEMDVKDIYAASVIVDTEGEEFADMTEEQKIEFGINAGDFFDSAMKYTAQGLNFRYDREEVKDERRTARATGGSGASSGGYRVMKYYAVADIQHMLAGGPDSQSEETVRMEVCHYPSVAQYKRKLLGEEGAVGDDEYALRRWFVPAREDTVPLIDVVAPRKIYQMYKTKKNGNGNGHSKSRQHGN